MLMGCYKEEGEYYYSLISSVSKMAEHQDKDYCVICEVSSFNIIEENEEGERVVSKEKVVEDRWYSDSSQNQNIHSGPKSNQNSGSGTNQNEKRQVEFELVGLTEKFFAQEDDPKDKRKKGIWRQYDNHGNVSRIISKRKKKENIGGEKYESVGNSS